jgi:hypothetical protein
VLVFQVAAEPVDSMKFTLDGATCSASYDFVTDCPQDTLLCILHDYKHIVKYLNGIALVIDTLGKGPGWNRLCYNYHYIVYTLSVTFYRARNDSAGTVTFETEKTLASSHIIPSAAAIKGYYRLQGLPDGRIRVYYGQTTTFDRKLSRLYAHLIKRELRKFLRKMELYIAERNS